jgi:DNA recombination protein RmuC
MGLVILACVGCAAVTAAITFLALRSRAASMEARLALAERDLAAARLEVTTTNDRAGALDRELAGVRATLETEKKNADKELAGIVAARDEMKAQFEALAASTLQANSKSFLELAQTKLTDFQNQAKGDLTARQKAIETLVQPIHESLKTFDGQIQQIEKSRSEAYGSLLAQLKVVSESNEQLRVQTGALVTALRAPQGRGRWGEIQLRRVAEMAGMLNRCDFLEQEHRSGEDGSLRPDMVVKLPGGKTVVVDAKTPLAAYLTALEAKSDSERAEHLRQHAAQVRVHIKKLAAKSYWEQFACAPEIVVMFLPNEAFFSAALAEDPTLIEAGVADKVIIASPTTLIALLRAVHYGWQQQEIAANATKIAELGKELYERLCTMAGHFEDVGGKLNQAVGAYNKAVSSLESRVLASARKFPELAIQIKEEIPSIDQVEQTTKKLQAGDWADTSEQLPLAEKAGAS